MCVCMGGGAALVVRKSNFPFIDAAAMKAKFYFGNFPIGGEFVKKQPDLVTKTRGFGKNIFGNFRSRPQLGNGVSYLVMWSI